ncbi:MAG: hypothetical protein SGJ09_16415 [Phycisphaerae bacterium]|nr:hypothetical protein [Phycisphaerae bacterium]
MEETNVGTWAEFLVEIDRIEDGRRAQTQRDGSTHVSEMLYLGQANASWELQTTLERLAPKVRSLEHYFRIIRNVKPEIETYTNQRWDFAEDARQQFENEYLDCRPQVWASRCPQPADSALVT